MSIPSSFFCMSHSCQQVQHLWPCFLASHEDCSAVIHGSRAVIGPVDDKFTQTTEQLVSEGSSGSVSPSRSTLLAEISHAKY